MKDKSVDILDRLSLIFNNSGFSVINIVKQQDNMYKMTIKKIEIYTILAFVRRVGTSGWSDKPEIRRVQVSGFNVNDLPTTNKHSTCMIIGIDKVFEKDILIVWNIYNYGLHKKNRSCYVKVVNIFKTFHQGYLTTTDSNQKIWISDSYHFDKLLNDYINFNKISMGDQV